MVFEAPHLDGSKVIEAADNNMWNLMVSVRSLAKLMWGASGLYIKAPPLSALYK